MKEIKVPGEVRQLIKMWRKAANAQREFASTRETNMAILAYGHAQRLEICADQLEATLKRPIKRAKLLANRSKRK